MERICNTKILDLKYVNQNREDYGQFAFLQAIIAGRDDNDYVAFCRKDEKGYVTQELFPVGKIRDSLTHARVRAEGNDVYVTANSFVSGNSRTIANVSHFNACFVDLDYKKIKKYQKTAPDKMALSVLARCKDVEMPYPAFIIATGHGLHCWWIFSKPLPNTYGKVWNAIQESICDAFKGLGADYASRDAARILRIPGTFNGKDQNQPALVKTVYEKRGDRTISAERMYAWAADRKKAIFYAWLRNRHPDKLGTLRVYQIESLVESGQFVLGKNEKYIPFIPFVPDAEIPVLKPVKAKTTRRVRGETAQECEARHRAAAFSVRANRIRDIEALAALRDWDVTGCRDLLLYYYVQFMRVAGYKYHKQERAAEALNAKFKEPLSDRELQSILHANSLLYDPSNTCLIQKLSISEQEERQMLTIFSRREKERRRIENSKTGMSRDERTEYMCARILACLAEGKNGAETAEELHCTRQCVSRYIRAYGLGGKAVAGCTKNTQRQGEVSRKERTRRAKEYAQKAMKKLRKDVGANTALCKIKHLSKKDRKEIADGMRRVVFGAGEEFWTKFHTFIEDFEKQNGARFFSAPVHGKKSTAPAFEKLFFSMSPACGAVRYGKSHENGISLPPLLPILADAA